MKAAELSGDWEQEISTQIDELSVQLEQIRLDLETTIEEGKTLWEDWELNEDALRASGGDEEFNKMDAEHI
ncbi:MAG: hypothetical protein NWE89_04355 [Candidatus Bathyarchaeota archaeon]|nr:hypothetical protein [Candidatus Bathyarchaeota archaeon]